MGKIIKNFKFHDMGSDLGENSKYMTIWTTVVWGKSSKFHFDATGPDLAENSRFDFLHHRVLGKSSKFHFDATGPDFAENS